MLPAMSRIDGLTIVANTRPFTSPANAVSCQGKIYPGPNHMVNRNANHTTQLLACNLEIEASLVTS